MASLTLTVLLSTNIPKFIKYLYAPRIDLFLYTYPKAQCEQKGAIQQAEGKTFDKEIQVKPNVSPHITLLVKTRWRYHLDVIEVCGHHISTIHRIDHFAKNRFWLEKEYTDIDGNYKVSPNLTTKNSHIMNPLILDLQLVPDFKEGEERKITVRVDVTESRKTLVKDFFIKASA